MLIRFKNEFALPVEDVFTYFRTPAEWVRLFGFSGATQSRGDGWYAVPLKGFPFPLVAKNTQLQEHQIVRWEFRGFWRGTGEVRFTETPAGVAVEGFEQVSVRWLGPFSPVVERLFLERGFRSIWEIGWRRLRKIEQKAS